MTTAETRTVGHIGLGQIGLPAATATVEAGYPTVGYRRTRAALEPLVAAGGAAAASTRAVVEAADVVLMCLPSVDALRAVMDEVVPALRPGQVIVELSTYPLVEKRRQADRVAERGAVMLDGEVSGTPGMVAARKAVVFVGGDAEAFETARPVLETFGVAFHLGDFGAATKMKLVANHLVAVHTMAAAEAMALATKAGLDPHQVAKVIAPGAGGSKMFEVRAPRMADRAFLPAPGPITTLEKYLHLAREMAADADCATPLLDVATEHYLAAMAAGRGHEDIAVVFEHLEALRRG